MDKMGEISKQMLDLTMSHVEDWLAQASTRKVLDIGNDMWVNNEKIVIINDIFVVANLLYKNISIGLELRSEQNQNMVTF